VRILHFAVREDRLDPRLSGWSPTPAAAAEHRVGSVPLGEPAVGVSASASHRGEAFAGARKAIDRIKAEAPIWKRQVEASGAERWIEGTAAPEVQP
jgi:molybdopterin synthase catalytic subunit